MRYLTILFLFISSLSFGADRYWVGGGSSANWNATGPTNWAATSGGAGNQTVPGSSDNVFFDGAGGSGNTSSTVSSAITVLSVTFSSGYTATVTINTGIVLTIAGNFTDHTNHSWTVNGTGSMTISATSTIASGGKTFPGPVTFTGASTTKTLNGNWTITGALASTSSSMTLNWTTNETLTCAGLTASNSFLSGSAKIILSGGTWSGSNAILNDLDIAGNVTVSGSVAFNTKTLTYVSGTVTTTGSTLTIGASTTLNTNGITWNNITFTTTLTATLNSLLSVSGTITFGASAGVTFAGSFGFTTATYSSVNTGAITHTFNDGVTYTITTALTAFTSRNAASLTFTSDHASNRANLILQQGATCNVLANFTRIDASAGRTIRSFNGTITDSLNVVAFNDIGTNKH